LDAPSTWKKTFKEALTNIIRCDVTMRKESIGTILAFITAIISGFAIPVNKMFVVGIDPIVFILAGINCKFKFSQFKKTKWSWLFLIGIIGGGIAFALYFSGLALTTSGRAAFLHKTLPIYVAVFSYLFLKERITKKQNMALITMLIGVFAILVGGVNPAQFWADPSTGDLLVLLGTILWGVENTLAKRAMLEEESNFTVTFARMFFGGVFLFGIVLLMGNMEVVLSLTTQQISNLLVSTTFLFGYVLFWYASLKYINVSKAAIILLLAPVISLFLGVWWYGEPVSMLQGIGSVLILAGAYFVTKVQSEFSSGV